MKLVASTAAAVGVVFGVGGAALPDACPPEDEGLLFHSCGEEAALEVLLLPEEVGAIDHPLEDGLVVSGAYTGRDTRAAGYPNPVGLFVDNGSVINPNLARMDGLLIVDREGQPEIHHRRSVPTGDAQVDLGDASARLTFAERVAETGRSVLQSHLLIVDGRIDVRPQADAPRHRRRILFSGEDGWGIFQTAGAETLHDAAVEVQRRFRPRMALNLDMGSYDYCVAYDDGQAANCGLIEAGEVSKLSNLLRMSRPSS